MSPEQKARILAKMYADFDAMEISQQAKDCLKEHTSKLMDRMEETGNWDPLTKHYLEGLDKLDKMIKSLKDGSP